MNLDNFAQQIQQMRQRVVQLEGQAKESPTLTQRQQPELTEIAFEEISIALEELEVANEELHQQNENLLVAYQAVAAESQRYQELFEFAPDGYLVTDPHGVIQEANCAAASLLNTPQELLVGKSLISYVVLEDCSAFYSQLNKLSQRQEEKLQEWEVRFQPPNQAPIANAVKVATIFSGEDKLVGLRWLLRDITERQQVEAEILKALQAERELNELKSRFVAVTSHEFRTPLTIILSSAGILERYRQRLSEEKQLTHLWRIQRVVDEMNQMLNDILTIAEAEAGKRQFNPKPLDLMKFCRELVETLQLADDNQHQILFFPQGNDTKAISSSHQEFLAIDNLELNPCLSAHIASLDSKLLQQILSNLLSNALKYSTRGSRVELSFTYFADQVVFKVKDQGMGIPPEDQPRLFEAFHRARNVGTIRGTGLGLAIVKHCVDLHQGKITFVSLMGEGTTFTVTLPLKH
ncbi:ATP-binding protein [Lyngbya aestuarii]|uniref:ATP-binding protein n=1 Tax=Lyngbya aestuarii TaxID=118322 RepID=UPI00403DE48A